MVLTATLLFVLTVTPSEICGPARDDRGACGGDVNGGAVMADPLGRGVWVVDEERSEVALVPDVGDPRTFQVGAGPVELVVDDTGRAFVACAEAGTVAVLDVKQSGVEIPVGTEPRSLAMDLKSRELFVGVAGENRLVTIDIDTAEVKTGMELPARPDHLALTPAGLAVLPRLDDAVYFVAVSDGATKRVGLGESLMPILTRSGTVTPPPRRRAWHGQALLPVEGGLFVFHSVVDPNADSGNSGARESTYGGGTLLPVTTNVAFIPYQNFALQELALADALDITGVALVNGYVAITDRSRGEVLFKRRQGNRLSALNGSFSTRPIVSASAAAPLLVGRGLVGAAAMPDGTVATFASFDRSVIKVSGYKKATGDGRAALKMAGEQKLAPSELDPELQRGRDLFFAATPGISSFGVSCQTCHVHGGREDGLTWSVDGDRRQTPQLAGRLHETGPFGWTGDTKTLEENITRTIKRLGGSGLDADDRHALARFLTEGLKAPPRPVLHEDPELIANGERLFHENAGCADCHDGPSLTDGKNYKLYPSPLAQQKPTKKREMNTPSLKFVALTAPYLHDGSAKTLEELVADEQDRMGNTKDLTAEERKALVAYLKTL